MTGMGNATGSCCRFEVEMELGLEEVNNCDLVGVNFLGGHYQSISPSVYQSSSIITLKMIQLISIWTDYRHSLLFYNYSSLDAQIDSKCLRTEAASTPGGWHFEHDLVALICDVSSSSIRVYKLLIIKSLERHQILPIFWRINNIWCARSLVSLVVFTPSSNNKGIMSTAKFELHWWVSWWIDQVI